MTTAMTDTAPAESTVALTAPHGPFAVLCHRCQCMVATGLVLDNHQVRWQGSQIGNTETEFRIITLLYTSAGRFLTYREIYDVIKAPGFLAGDGNRGMEGNVRSAIKRLRQKFMLVGLPHDVIENRQAVGYRWKGDGT